MLQSNERMPLPKSQGKSNQPGNAPIVEPKNSKNNNFEFKLYMMHNYVRDSND
jgi:hypothetical protein